METDNIVKKGTTTVGIVCKDGLVLAADKRATAGNLIVDKEADKIYIIADNMAVTMAGTVSDAQLLLKLIKAETALKRIRTKKEPSVKETANMLASLVYSNIRKFSVIPGISHFILGGHDEEGFHVYDLFADGSLTKCDKYISSGSGSVMAYGVLETLFKPDLNIDDGIQLAVKCVNAALQRDSASGNGLDVVTVTGKGVERVVRKMLDQKIKL